MSQTTRKPTILIADNDPPFLRLLSSTLAFEGLAVVAVEDGEQAIEQTQTQRPDVVLLDLLMPKVDGLTACQRIREFSALPIIILTAWIGEQERTQALALCANAYLVKPFDMDELLSCLRALFFRKKGSLE